MGTTRAYRTEKALSHSLTREGFVIVLLVITELYEFEKGNENDSKWGHKDHLDLFFICCSIQWCSSIRRRTGPLLRALKAYSFIQQCNKYGGVKEDCGAWRTGQDMTGEGMKYAVVSCCPTTAKVHRLLESVAHFATRLRLPQGMIL